jgi:hypothetical protein
VERVAAARALTGSGRTAVTSRATLAGFEYTFAVASREDDEDIRRLLRETVFPGAVKLSLEREPDSLAAGAIEGADHHTIVARDARTHGVAAIASRSERIRYLNGVPAPVGYLGQLRMTATRRSRRKLIEEGFEFCRRLHESGNARVYLASVVAENRAALRLLARRSAAWPRFQSVSRFVTLVIPVRRPIAHRSSINVQALAEYDLDEAVACLNRNCSRYQFAPVWTADDLTGGVPGLSTGRFLVAHRGGRMTGCAALWDQRSFRQVIVRGYSPLLARFRTVVNATSRWTSVPELPPVNTRLDFGYVSHLAVDGDDAETACALIAAVSGAASLLGLAYVAIGLPDGTTLTEAVRKTFAHRSYESVLHVAFWPDGERVASSLDGRPCLPELGTL